MKAYDYLQSRRDAHRYYRDFVNLAYVLNAPLADSESDAPNRGERFTKDPPSPRTRRLANRDVNNLGKSNSTILG
jgi:hypothetical protein